jgi:hypothetical protein
MSKKPSRRPAKQMNDLTEESLMAEMAEMGEQRIKITDDPKPAPALTSNLLKDVRVAALKMSADAAHNIAELESWRNEIDATIAFLRAQRK